MELTLTQLQAVTLGALDICREEEGFRFFRMTETQAAAFTRANETFAPKCRTSSGVRLDFETDSTFLEMCWTKPVFAAPTFCFLDVLVDGVPVLHSGTPDCGADTQGAFSLTLPEGSHRVQIFLPTKVGVCLASVKLSDGAKVIPCRPKQRFLLHGDSITQGYDACRPSGCYANLLARHYDAEILNQAVGGAGFDPDAVEYVGEFDFALIAYGTNDWSKKDLQTLERDAKAFLDKFRAVYPGLRAGVLLPIWRADAKTKENTAGEFMCCRDLLGQLAARCGFVVLDGYELVPHDTDLFADNRLHPNDEGFAFYAQRLIELLEKTGAIHPLRNV